MRSISWGTAGSSSPQSIMPGPGSARLGPGHATPGLHGAAGRVLRRGCAYRVLDLLFLKDSQRMSHIALRATAHHQSCLPQTKRFWGSVV